MEFYCAAVFRLEVHYHHVDVSPTQPHTAPVKEIIYLRNAAGQLGAWRRTHVRDLQIATLGAGANKTGDEKFLDDLVASHPDLLGLAGADDDSDIEGPFRAFTQVSLRALNGRMIAPDLVLLSRSGHIVVVEVKLSDK